MGKSQPECKKEHVRFGSNTVHAVIKVDQEDKPKLWYSSNELSPVLKDDQERAASHQSETDSFTPRGLEEGRALSRAVNAKNDPIKSYMKDVLGVYQYGKIEYGITDPESLGRFAVSRSVQDRKWAESVAVQDAQEALICYLDELEQQSEAPTAQPQSCARTIPNPWRDSDRRKQHFPSLYHIS